MYRTPRKIQKGMFGIKCQNLPVFLTKLKHIKPLKNNCHISELGLTFAYAENCGLNLDLYNYLKVYLRPMT